MRLKGKEIKIHTVGKSEREGAMVASLARETRRKGGIGPICLVLNEARRAAFYSNHDTYKTSSLRNNG